MVVCNHGVFASRELERQDMDEIMRMVDVNLIGTQSTSSLGVQSREKDLRAQSTSLLVSMATEHEQGRCAWCSEFYLKTLACSCSDGSEAEHEEAPIRGSQEAGHPVSGEGRGRRAIHDAQHGV